MKNNIWFADFLSWGLTPASLCLAAGVILSVAAVAAPSRRGARIVRALCGVAMILAMVLEISAVYHSEAPQMALDDPFARWIRLAVFVGGFMVLYLRPEFASLSENTLDDYDKLFAPMTLMSVGGLAFASSAYDLIALFVGVEGAMFPLYVLMAKSAANVRFRSVFVALAFSSAVSAFGMALLYGISGATDLLQVKVNLSLLFLMYQKIGPGFVVAFAMIFLGTAFKMGLPPFHLWLADLADRRAPGLRSLTLWVGVTAGLIVFCRVFLNTLSAFSTEVMAPLDWGELVTALATFGLVVCAAVLWRERDLPRFILFLAIAQSALLVTGGVAVNDAALRSALYHFAAFTPAFLLSSLLVERLSDSRHELAIENLRGWFWRQPVVAGAFTVALLTLGAAPFTVGFVARRLAVEASVRSESWWALSVIGVVSLVLLSVTLRVVFTVFQRAEATVGSLSLSERPEPRWPREQVALAVFAAIAMVYLAVSSEGAEQMTLAAARTFSF